MEGQILEVNEVIPHLMMLVLVGGGWGSDVGQVEMMIPVPEMMGLLDHLLPVL